MSLACSLTSCRCAQRPDPRCELLMCDVGGLVSRPVQWTPTRRWSKHPAWDGRWVREQEPRWRRCFRRRARAAAPEPDGIDDGSAGGGDWHCPSAIRLLEQDPESEEPAVAPAKTVTVKVWDHNRGRRRRTAESQAAAADGESWLQRRYEKISVSTRHHITMRMPLRLLKVEVAVLLCPGHVVRSGAR